MIKFELAHKFGYTGINGDQVKTDYCQDPIDYDKLLKFLGNDGEVAFDGCMTNCTIWP
jgi:hypothetical protein